MKKIINGKKYDTETAVKLGEYANNYDRSNFDYFIETLYRKKTGEFFLHGEGGPRSKYSIEINSHSWSGGEKIAPLTEQETKTWAEKYLDADEYEEIFGEVEE